MVDAKHVLGEIDTAPEVLEQLAFADVVILNKTDLVTSEELATVEARIRKINPLATIHQAERCNLPLEAVLGRDAFNLQHVLEIEPNFLTEDHAHDHDEEVGSLSLVSDEPMDDQMFSAWIRHVTQAIGTDILRMKGIIAFKNDPQRFVVQGVHMLLEGDYQRAWKADEKRQSRLVFIGRDLPEQMLRDGFAQCRA